MKTKNLTMTVTMTVLLLAGATLAAQDTILFGKDSNYLFRYADYGSNNYLLRMTKTKEGINIPVQPEGTKMYGVSVPLSWHYLYNNYPRPKVYAECLYVDGDSIVVVDSIMISDLCPTKYINVMPEEKPACTLPERAYCRDSIIPLYEALFRKPIPLDERDLYLVIHNAEDLGANYSFNGTRPVLLDMIKGCVGQRYNVIGIDYDGSVILIGDDYRHVVISPIINPDYVPEMRYYCDAVGILGIDADESVARLSWGRRRGNCEYEVLYWIEGSTDSVSVFTQDTSLYVYELQQDSVYQFKVRAKCCWSADDEEWGIWSQSKRYSYSRPPVPPVPRFRVATRSSNERWGTVEGGGEYEEGDTAVIRAIPLGDSIRFVGWIGGDTVNPVEIEVSHDTSFFALFRMAGAGGGGDTVPQGDTTAIESPGDGIKFLLSPNPVRDMLEVEMLTGGEYDVEIYDTRGVCVYSRRHRGCRFAVDVSKYAPGRYAMVLVSNNHHAMRSFVKR